MENPQEFGIWNLELIPSIWGATPQEIRPMVGSNTLSPDDYIHIYINNSSQASDDYTPKNKQSGPFKEAQGPIKKNRFSTFFRISRGLLIDEIRLSA